jgi:hypothetical protein
MEQTPMWRARSARWAMAAALLAAGALGGGVLGATLSASADPAMTPSTRPRRRRRTPTASSRSDEEGRLAPRRVGTAVSNRPRAQNFLDLVSNTNTHPR